MDRPGNLMMICAVLSFRRADRRRRAQVGGGRALRAFPPLPPASGRCADWRVLGDHARFRSRPPRRSRRASGRRGKRELQALVSRLAATPLNPAAAVAVPRRRELRRRQRRHHPHPPLLRRRDRARAGAAVDDGCRARGSAGARAAVGEEQARGSRRQFTWRACAALADALILALQAGHLAARQWIRALAEPQKRSRLPSRWAHWLSLQSSR